VTESVGTSSVDANSRRHSFATASASAAAGAAVAFGVRNNGGDVPVPPFSIPQAKDPRTSMEDYRRSALAVVDNMEATQRFVDPSDRDRERVSRGDRGVRGVIDYGGSAEAAFPSNFNTKSLPFAGDDSDDGVGVNDGRSSNHERLFAHDMAKPRPPPPLRSHSPFGDDASAEAGRRETAASVIVHDDLDDEAV
jgi:hypothetical protein